MPFDLETAKPINNSSDGFDLSTAKPVTDTAPATGSQLGLDPKNDQMMASHEQSQPVPQWKETVSQWARPLLEGGGMLAGGAIASPGVITTPVGAGVGFMAGSELADRIDEGLGIKKIPTFGQQIKDVGVKAKEGAEYAMTGEIGGKILGAAGSKVQNILRRSSIGITSKGAENVVAKTLEGKNITSPQYLDNLGESANLGNKLGVDYTLGQSTNSPSMIMAERSAFRSGDMADVGKNQFVQGQKAIKSYADNTLGGGSVENTISAIKNRQDHIIKTIDGFKNDVQTLQSAADTGINDINAGDTIKNTIQANKAAARMQSGELYNLVPDVKLQPLILNDAIGLLKKDFDPAIEDISNYPAKIIDGISSKITGKEGLEDISFNDLRKIRTLVLSDMRKAKSGMSPNDQLARRLGIVQNALEDTINTTRDIPGEAGNAFRAASEFYKENYVIPFKTGIVQDILSKDGSGVAKIRNAQVAGKFFLPGDLGKEVAGDFYGAVGDDVLARESMKSYIQNQMLNNITDQNGNIVTKKLSGFVKKFEPALKEYGLFDNVKTLQNAQSLVDSSSEELALFNRSSAAKVLGSSPDNVIKQIFSGNSMVNPERTTREILNVIGNDRAAANGFKTALKDHIFSQSETNGVEFGGLSKISNAALKKTINKYEPVIKELYKNEPDKIQAWTDIRKGMDILYRTESSPMGGGSDTAENLLNLVTNTAGTAFTHRLIVLHAVRNIGKMIGKIGDDNVNVLMNRAMLDPDLAYNLIHAAKGDIPISRLEQSLKNTLLSSAIYTVTPRSK